MSTHPIAVSIREELSRQVPDAKLNMNLVTDTENITGKGLVAVIEGKKILVGNGVLLDEAGISYTLADDPAATIVYVAEEDRYLGAILIRDSVKKDAKVAIAMMKKEGVRRVIMLTGDRKSVGVAVGKELGLDQVCAELLPQDKVSRVEGFLSDLGGSSAKGDTNEKRGRLAFIGDGINDAPVLSRADIGIAMGSMGSDAAIEAADVVIMDDDLTRIPSTIRIARKTVRISTQNIIFALTVKILILLLGALGIANMWAAVFADVGVAVICILNSMRLVVTKE
jgi:Cd2+/Zn2+-exporting ATPase